MPLLATLWMLGATAAAPPPLALTISGGATLGVHEAGYLYVLTEALARLPDGPELVLATGASAGSGNTLVAALGACGPPRDTPEADLGWQTWVGNGFADILDPALDSPVSLFSQQAMFDQVATLQALWARGLSADCDVTVAIPVTRLHAAMVPVDAGLRLPRQTLRFVVRIEGLGPGRPPRLSTVRGPASHQLPLTGDSTADLALLWDVVVASAAFPGAFAPVELGFCRPDAPTCTVPDHTALFVDGGVFDNVPLRMAHRLTADRPNVRHLYLDPAIRSYPEAAPDPPGREALDLDSYLSAFAGGFVAQARSNELYALAEHDPEVFARVMVSTARLPQAGAHLENFLGLFEESFRRFDYALGMADAWMELPATTGVATAQDDLAPLLATPAWSDARCIHGWLVGDAAEKTACTTETDPDFRALLAVAIGRAWTDCARLPPDHPATRDHAVCRAAAAGQAPPSLVPGLEHPTDLLVRPDEDALAHAFRVLAAAGFAYHDLGLPPDQAHRAPGEMADQLSVAIDGLARSQTSVARSRLVATGGRQVLAAVLDAPTDPRRFYVASGTVGEVGGSVQPLPGAAWLRLHAALQGDGLVSLLTRDSEEFSLSPSAGVELDPSPRSTGPATPVLGVRASRQLGAPDAYGAGACPPTLDPRLCSQGVLQGYGAVTFLRAIRSQVGVDVHPWLPHAGPRYDLQLILGVEL